MEPSPFALFIAIKSTFFLYITGKKAQKIKAPFSVALLKGFCYNNFVRKLNSKPDQSEIAAAQVLPAPGRFSYAVTDQAFCQLSVDARLY
jgi:hypothetical protein